MDRRPWLTQEIGTKPRHFEVRILNFSLILMRNNGEKSYLERFMARPQSKSKCLPPWQHVRPHLEK